MDDVQRLERRLEELSERLRRVEELVLDDGVRPRRRTAGSPAAASACDAESELDTFAVVTVLPLIGRSLIVMGGAFLLRWLTQSGVLPQETGSIIGMAYALAWIVMADVAAGRGQRYSSAFHGVTGAMIALPLIAEATSKFHFLPPAVSSVSLVVFVIIGLVVAGRRRLRVLAWIIAVPAAPMAFTLAHQTGALTPFLLSLLVLGFVTLWLGYMRHWTGLATLMAAAANAGMTLLVLDHAKNVENTGVLELGLWEPLLLLIGLIVVYFGSYCFRIFSRKRTITALEIGQTLSVILIGLGGIAIVVNARGQSMMPLGVVCVALSAACYGSAYGFLPRLDPDRRNFLFFTLIGLGTCLLGWELIFGRTTAAMIFSVTGLVAGALARPIKSPVLYLHGAAYVFAAGIRSEMLLLTADGFIGATSPTAEWAGAPVLCALAATLLYPWFARPEGRRTDVALGRRAVEVLSLVTVLALGGVAIALVGGWLPAPEDAAYRGILAAARTAALALAAAAIAWSCRRARFHYMAWPVYVLLAFGALKILMEDARTGASSIMFIAFGLYGGALILAPRLLRQASARKSRNAPSA